MDNPIYLGFSGLKLNRLLMYETYYDKFHPHFGEKNITYYDTDAFLRVKTKILLKTYLI